MRNRRRRLVSRVKVKGRFRLFLVHWECIFARDPYVTVNASRWNDQVDNLVDGIVVVDWKRGMFWIRTENKGEAPNPRALHFQKRVRPEWPLHPMAAYEEAKSTSVTNGKRRVKHVIWKHASTLSWLTREYNSCWLRYEHVDANEIHEPKKENITKNRRIQK